MKNIKKPTGEKKQFTWPKNSDTRKVVNGDKKKKCGKCGKWLTVDRFPTDRHRVDGLYGYCRDCESERQKIKNAKKKGRGK
ncbi:MAG: hypothetical protein K8S16_19690 [Bacteroidales bacterium]|nr:hypothetical protein [Bacteroidales bacterium]